MTEPPKPAREPTAERLAERLDAASTRPTLAAVLRDLGRLDLAAYRAIAATSTPTLDQPLRQLSDVATRSKLWLGIAGAMAVVGGKTGRRAALNGIVALAVDSAAVNVVGKLWFRRRRPNPAEAGVPKWRRLRMPTSLSFPSGHAASGFAFAEAVGEVAPAIAMPLRLLAALVAYSRVHTGVHYPGDVIAGALIGSSIGEAVGLAARRIQDRQRP